jgi:hypothetical protein
MTRSNRLIFAGVLCLVFTACGKEKSLDPSDKDDENPMLGNWKFVSLNVKGESIVEVPIMDAKTVSLFEYTTKNNAGTANVTKDKFSYSGLTYSVDTTFTSYFYEQGVLVDSFDFPLTETLPVTTAVTPYEYFAPDSIYYPGGSPMNMGGATVTTQASGGRFRIENDLLIITTRFNQTRTQTSQGMQSTITGRGVSIATLQKQ